MAGYYSDQEDADALGVVSAKVLDASNHQPITEHEFWIIRQTCNGLLNLKGNTTIYCKDGMEVVRRIMDSAQGRYRYLRKITGNEERIEPRSR